MTGTIATVKFEQGFGFIRDDDGVSYFFHRSHLDRDGVAWENLKCGDRVEFTEAESDRGPRADRVRVVNGDDPRDE